MSLPAPIGQPTLIYCPHPLLATAGRQFRFATFLPGESIAAFLERLDIELGSQPVFLRLNDQLIARSEWALTVPKAGDLITIRARVKSGGGGGKSPLATILSIAVMIVAPYAGAAIASAAELGTAFTVFGQAISWGRIIGGVISIAGSLLINAILPPPKPQLAQAQARGLDNPSPTYSLAGGSNRARPYEPLLVILGRHRAFPDYGAKPYTEFDGDDQYLYQVFHFGLTDVLLSDFRIGATPIESFEGVTIQQSGEDGVLTLFPGNVDTIPGADLTHAAGWIQRTSSINARELAIEVTGSLFAAGQDGIGEASVEIEIQYRKVGATDWLPGAPGTTSTLYHASYWSAGRYNSHDGESNWVQVAYGGVDAGEHAAGEVQSVVDAGDTVVVNMWRYRPYSEINGGVPGSILYEPAPTEGYDTFATATTIRSSSRKPLRLTYRIPGDGSQYEVRLRRVTEDSTDPQLSSTIGWSQLRTYQPDTADYTGQKRVAVKIKASGQLQGTLQQFSAIASARTRAWDGVQWATVETSNPAWSLLAALRGKKIGSRRAWGCNVAEARIDLDNLIYFGAWCEAKGLTFNGVIDTQMNCLDLLNAIARCGRGSVTLASGKYGVVWDAADQPVVAVFGMGNIKAESFSVKWVSEKLGDEIVVNFWNPDLDWQQDSVRALVPGVVDPVNPVTVDLFGCIDKTMAGKEANLIAAAQKYRRRFVTFETDFEGNVVNRGDVVALSHELFAMGQINAWGYSGRLVAAASASQLTVDRPVTMSNTQPNYIGVRYPDGTLYVRQVTYAAGEQTVLNLAAALPSNPATDPSSPLVDYIWLFGLDAAGAAKKFKVHEAQPLSERDVRLILVDENPLYYAAESGAFTYDAPTPFVAQLPVISNLTVAEELVRVGNALAVELSLTWDVTGVYDHANVRARLNGTQLEDRSTTGRRISYQVPPNGTIELEVTAVHPIYGAGPGSRASVTHEIVGLAANPSDVPWFAIDGDRLSFGTVADLDLAGYRIKFHYGRNDSWGDATPLHEGLIVASPFTMVPRPQGQVTIMIKAVDTLGVGNSDAAHESDMPAIIVTDLGDALVANVVETIDLGSHGWPGEIVNGAIDGANDIVADNTTTMWNPSPDTSMWTLDSALMWHANLSKDMYYVTQIQPVGAGEGSVLTLAHDIEADAYKIEYRRNGPGPMWTADAELMWSADASVAMWTLPPGDFPRPMWTGNSNLMWSANASTPMWRALEGGYQVWPGSIAVLNEPYDFRVTTSHGVTVGKIKDMVFTVDMPDIVERLNDVVIAAAGTRLPITQSYRVIKNVNMTIQADGNGAVGVRIEDKNAALGPLVKTMNDAGAFVNGKVDATIQGY